MGEARASWIGLINFIDLWLDFNTQINLCLYNNNDIKIGSGEGVGEWAWEERRETGSGDGVFVWRWCGDARMRNLEF